MGLYDYVNVGHRIRRSSYPSVSYENIFDCDFGDGVPVMARFALPGDIWRITNSGFFRTLPLFAPQFTGIKVKFRNFFVSLRNLDENAEEILTGGEDGMSQASFGSVTITPKKYGFYDYLGVSLTKNDPNNEGSMANYWLRAYRLIYNEWYRDEKLQDELDITEEDDTLFKVNFSRDYFTSAFLSQQLGVAPALPLSGVLPVDIRATDYEGNLTLITDAESGDSYAQGSRVMIPEEVAYNQTSQSPMYYPSGSNLVTRQGDVFVDNARGGVSEGTTNGVFAGGMPIIPPTSEDEVNNIINSGYAQLAHMRINLANAGGQFNIQDLRRGFAFQSVLERANVAGNLYNEFLRANFGISPTDETLQRPVYLGGSASYINVSEVIQQSQTTESSPLGTQGGKGIGVTSNTIKPYLVKEPGIMMTIMSITPDTMYNSQGIDRQYTYKTRWDFFNPSFQNLGEQAIRNSELYVKSVGQNDVDDNDDIFGYEPMYQELRGSQNVVAGSFRDTLSYWHLARKFEDRPNLDSDFIQVSSERDQLNRIFVANDTATYKPFYCHIYNKLDVIRPLIRYPIGAGLVQGV